MKTALFTSHSAASARKPASSRSALGVHGRASGAMSGGGKHDTQRSAGGGAPAAAAARANSYATQVPTECPTST